MPERRYLDGVGELQLPVLHQMISAGHNAVYQYPADALAHCCGKSQSGTALRRAMISSWQVGTHSWQCCEGHQYCRGGI